MGAIIPPRAGRLAARIHPLISRDEREWRDELAANHAEWVASWERGER